MRKEAIMEYNKGNVVEHPKAERDGGTRIQ